ncbi:MAG: NAD(P)-dependent oxidoreductase [Gemmatimonadota bacterium]|nr:NAD(P)-dependent oxidoreductase [Gemmatimonadota bacterium]
MSGRPEADLEGRRALVLGASGFIGRWVAAALEGAGARVTPVARDREAAEAALTMAGVRAVPVTADLADFDEAAALVREGGPHVVCNLVGYGVDRSERDADVAQRLNAELPARLAALARENGAALVHAGSALEYGVADRVGETDEPRPTTDYGRTKLAGTRAVEAEVDRGLRGTTARLFTVYGPGEHPGRLLPCLLDAAASGDPVELTEGRQARDFTYVADVAEGILRLAAAERPPAVVNLATGRLTTVRRFVELAARELRMEADRLRFGARPGRPEEMAHEPVPIARLEESTGWRPGVGIAEGVRRTVEVLGAEEIA